jgi:hypothetical protein
VQIELYLKYEDKFMKNMLIEIFKPTPIELTLEELEKN